MSHSVDEEIAGVIALELTRRMCSTLWGERERGSVVGVNISSHRKLIGYIGYCRSPQLLAFSAGRSHTG